MIFWCFLLWWQLLRGHDSFGIKAEERTQAKSIGKTSVVVSETKPPEAQQEDATGLVRHAGGASFTGPTVVEEHQSCNGECFQYRIGALEMFLHEAQQEDGRVLRTMWEALDKGAGFAGKPMEQMESMGKMGESPNGSGKGIVSESQECFTTQKKQGRQRSWQRWIQERQRCRIWTTICIAIAICKLPVSADFNYTMGWRSTSAGSITIPALAVLTSDADCHKHRVGGCKAYGTREQMPADVRELVDKVAQQSSKNITKELHTETSNLGRAKKALVEIVESRRQHRQAWTQHLRDSIAMWNKQLQQFTEHQAMLSEREGRAIREIQSATRAIQELNNKAVGGSDKTFTPSMPEVMESSLEEPKKDQEAEDLKAQLHKVLADCAKAIGVESKEGLNSKEDIVTIDSDKEDLQTSKRARSAEKGDKGTSS